MKYESATNRRLRNPSHAQSLAEGAVSSLSETIQLMNESRRKYRVVIGLGPGRSGTKSLAELLSSQTDVVHAEHEMIVPRFFGRDPSGRIDVTTCKKDADDKGLHVDDAAKHSHDSDTRSNERNTESTGKKRGSWGADRRLEWDTPRLVRGSRQRTDEEEAMWRVLRLLEQREAFSTWVRDASTFAKEKTGMGKGKKLGGRGWREHKHNSNNGNAGSMVDSRMMPQQCALADTADTSTSDIPVHVVAAVSSVGLGYVHEYVALDPTVRIVVLMRPREEVVSSFLNKSKGRNHWQRHSRRQSHPRPLSCGKYVQPDKTWDSAFPNMSDDECEQFMEGVGDDKEVRPSKTCALRAYWELYNLAAKELSERYQNNVRIFDMKAALNDTSVKKRMLNWCGFNIPVLDTVHLNKKKI